MSLAAGADDASQIEGAPSADAWQLAGRLLECGSDAFFAVDREWRLLHLNGRAEAFLGERRDALLGLRLWDLFPDAASFAGYPHLLRAMDERAPVAFDEYVAFLGRWVELRVYPSAEGCWCFFHDVSERKRVEQQLYEAERQAHADAQAAAERAIFLAEATSTLAAQLDYDATIQRLARLAVPRLADLCTIHMLDDNGALRQLAVAHSDPAVEALMWELDQAHPRDFDTLVGLVLVAHTGAPELVTEIDDARLLHFARAPERLAMLRRLHMISSLCLPLVARGRTLGAISFIMAESGRHYREGETQLAEELARRAALAVDNARLYRDAQEALRTRDQFLSVAAHELRTPLTALSGSTQLFARRARRDGTLNQRDDRSIQLILSQAERLNRLIASLLDLSRIQLGVFSLDAADLDLNALVRRVVEEYLPLLDTHSIIVQGEADALMVRGDELRLDQVFQNLIQNAVKYSPGGGDVTVQLAAEESWAHVSVRDTGVGIPADALPHLFQRFYRAPNATEQSGLGIGLHVVQEVVSLHGGAVRVASQEGAGSTFTVQLPLLA